MPDLPITAKDKLHRIDDLLDSYEKSIGLPTCQAPGTEEDLNKIICIDRQSLESLHLEECSALVFKLAQYSFYLQRLQNREKTRETWATEELNKIVSAKFNDYDKYMKFDMRVASVIKEDSYAESIHKILIYARQRSQRLDFLSMSLTNLSNAMKSVQHTKEKMVNG